MNTSRRDFLRSIAVSGVAAGPVLAAESDPPEADADLAKQPAKGRAPLEARLRALREKTGLVITSIESFTRGGTLSVVRLRTDDGSEGYGQISTYDADISAMVLHRKIARHALGRDPAQFEAISQRCIEAQEAKAIW